MFRIVLCFPGFFSQSLIVATSKWWLMLAHLFRISRLWGWCGGGGVKNCAG